MDWNWQSCKIHLIQPEVGYAVGADPGKEKHVILTLRSPRMTHRPPTVGGAMAEWDFFMQTGSPYRGTWSIDYNSLNPNYNYNLAGEGSDPDSKIWQWNPEGVLKISYRYFMNDTGAKIEDAVDLRDATAIAGGVQPAAGRYSTSNGFVNKTSPILRRGTVYWERV